DLARLHAVRHAEHAGPGLPTATGELRAGESEPDGQSPVAGADLNAVARPVHDAEPPALTQPVAIAQPVPVAAADALRPARGPSPSCEPGAGSAGEAGRGVLQTLGK